MFRTDRYEAMFCATCNGATPRWKKIHSMFNEPFEQIWIAHLSAQSRKKNLSSWEIKYFMGNQRRIRCSHEEEEIVTLFEWRWLFLLLLWRTICLSMCHYSVLFTLLPFEGRCKLSYGKLFWLACWEGDVIAKIIKSFCHILNHSLTGEAEFSSHKRTLPEFLWLSSKKCI